MITKIFKSLLLVGIVASVLSFDIPKGWLRAGSMPDKYEMGMQFGAGRTSVYAATIQSNSHKIFGFGTLMQNMLPDNYKGKKIRLIGYMKSQDVRNWAGFWLRVDGADKKRSLSFDNMYDRPVKGTTEWRKYEIVLDVPETATNIAFGALLNGTGKIWFDDLKIEIAGDAARTTDRTPKATPQNLTFEE